ncbi:uncharacterized protein C8Q71DRAFT_187788 [Rhodofomes roseus]|uniref:BTB domain-containing protein n=1 Tax=Rhodofomes roseus TaxID=34475 RepID=A0ABQ8K8U3_9APHY|nr:uncharacterized protein C8Q71DRAFT_187788 [Rhodofomes roseus]KAH9833508.1 hypothetical protein C8Q71DRAFT_187788 [Rhodofomes roseus]
MSPTKHDRFYFDDGNVIFLVEETLFNIHRYFLKRDSPVFQDMFSMHSDEGRSDDSPILLEGTKSVDFACLLACLYPRSVGEVDEMHAEEWAAVIDLAVKWQFDAVFKLAVKQMKSPYMNSPTLALQIATARRHNMDSWYVEAVLKMCERSRPISPEEGEQLGLLETIRVSAMRQKLHSGSGKRGSIGSIYGTMPAISIPPIEQTNIMHELGISSEAWPSPTIHSPSVPPPGSPIDRRPLSPAPPPSLYD